MRLKPSVSLNAAGGSSLRHAVVWRREIVAHSLEPQKTPDNAATRFVRAQGVPGLPLSNHTSAAARRPESQARYVSAEIPNRWANSTCDSWSTRRRRRITITSRSGRKATQYFTELEADRSGSR
jgi:hypothetical protein